MSSNGTPRKLSFSRCCAFYRKLFYSNASKEESYEEKDDSNTWHCTCCFDSGISRLSRV